MAKQVRWEILNLGWFSRNRYWGESDDQAVRGALCVSTFVEIDGRRLVIDPSSPNIGELLFNRTGCRAETVDTVFITHYHADHFVGLECFPNAKILCAPMDYDSILQQLSGNPSYAPDLAGRLERAPEEIIPGAQCIALPGHTPGLCGVLFDTPEGKVAVAGDAVMTRDFFRNRQGYYNAVDQEASAQSIEKLASIAQWVVPGHGNYFPVD